MNRGNLTKAWLREQELPEQVHLSLNDSYKERVLQLGEGNFLRGFIDWMIQHMNKNGQFQGKVVAIQPTPRGKVVPKLNRQDCLYTLVLRGVEEGERVEKVEVIDAINRAINPYEDWTEVCKAAESIDIKFFFSNTTEAGLTYLEEEYDPHRSPLSFPGKLAALLYHRYKVLKGAKDAGWVIIPCELVEENGEILKQLVLKTAAYWHLPQEFVEWMEETCIFCNTLVDRIVTGYPKDEAETYQQLLGYEDELLTVGEPYHLFVIETKEELQEELQQLLPFHKAGLNVHWAAIKPFRELKVKLLNGPHTIMAAVGFLSGLNTVLDVMEDKLVYSFIREAIFEEIIPTFEHKQEALNYAESILDRFRNPFNKHYLADIGLNSTFKYKTRLLPTLLDYSKQYDRLPKAITFSLAALIYYFKPYRWAENELKAMREGEVYKVQDNEEVIQTFYQAWQRFAGSEESIKLLVTDVLNKDMIWGQDLNQVAGLTETVSTYVADIHALGMRESINKLLG